MGSRGRLGVEEKGFLGDFYHSFELGIDLGPLSYRVIIVGVDKIRPKMHLTLMYSNNYKVS